MKPTVLLMGFEPFGGDETNPSWDIASQLDGWPVRLDGSEEGPPIAVVQSVRLPCVFHEALNALDHALARHRPVAVIGLGLAASRHDISVERIAINVDDARIPDNAGRQPIDTPVCPGAPAAYWSTLPIKAIVAALQEAGIAASVSQSAGTFVCNHVFFGLAHRLAGRRRRAGPVAARRTQAARPASASARGGFIHVPWPASQAQSPGANGGAMDLETMTEAIRIAIRTTLTAGEADLRLPGGALD